MMDKFELSEKDVIFGPVLNNEQIYECLKTSLILLKTMGDRPDLHNRGDFERFTNIAMGEIAERSVIAWLRSNGKYAESAVDKHSEKPDRGYDLILKKNDRDIHCSIKSSLSVYKSDVKDILSNFTISTKKKEITSVNIQVYFWLKLNAKPRFTVPSELNMGIIGWLGRKDFENASFDKYSTEERESPDIKLSNIRSMKSLLDFLS